MKKIVLVLTLLIAFALPTLAQSVGGQITNQTVPSIVMQVIAIPILGGPTEVNYASTNSFGYWALTGSYDYHEHTVIIQALGKECDADWLQSPPNPLDIYVELACQ